MESDDDQHVYLIFVQAGDRHRQVATAKRRILPQQQSPHSFSFVCDVARPCPWHENVTKYVDFIVKSHGQSSRRLTGQFSILKSLQVRLKTYPFV
jgi:hypothetical protein